MSGLDLSPGMLNGAAAKAQGLGWDVALQQGDVARMPYADASFDSVVDTFSMCVFPDPAAALLEMRRVLRPGGKLLLLEHTRSSLPLLGAYQDLTADTVAATGKGCVWNQRVLDLVSDAGFTVTRSQPHLGGLLATVQAAS